MSTNKSPIKPIKKFNFTSIQNIKSNIVKEKRKENFEKTALFDILTLLNKDYQINQKNENRLKKNINGYKLNSLKNIKEKLEKLNNIQNIKNKLNPLINKLPANYSNEQQEKVKKNIQNIKNKVNPLLKKTSFKKTISKLMLKFIKDLLKKNKKTTTNSIKTINKKNNNNINITNNPLIKKDIKSNNKVTNNTKNNNTNNTKNTKNTINTNNNTINEKDLKDFIINIYKELKPYKKKNIFGTNLRQFTKKIWSLTDLKKIIEKNDNKNKIENSIKTLIVLICYNYGVSLDDSTIKSSNTNLFYGSKQIINHPILNEIYEKIIEKININKFKKLSEKIQNICKYTIEIIKNIKKNSIVNLNSIVRISQRQFMNYNNEKKNYDIDNYIIYLIAYYYDFYLSDNEIEIIKNRINNK